MTIYVRGNLTDGQCGIGRLSSFVNSENLNAEMYADAKWWSNEHGETKVNVDGFLRKYQAALPIDELVSYEQHKGGTGLFGTGFINTNVCRQAWEALTKTFPLVFITPVRMNKNSNNKFFYAMFDDKRNEDVTYIEPPEWPFK